ncbi:MAG TPA: hypothetical protein VHE35_25155 [Kofleriaceae bacterium]|nr:hypothetical protein [Kofleriaceae bacterium]
MRRTSLLSSSIAATLLVSLLAACGGGDDATPAKFSAATDLQRQRAIGAAAGTDAALAFFVGAFSVQAPPEATCPTVTHQGSTATAVFDCDSGGQRIDGRIVAENVGNPFSDSGPASDPTRAVVLTFDGYRQHADTAAEELALDGTLTLRPDQAMVIALEVSLGGVAVDTDATLTSDGTLSRAADGSSIEVDGLGRATIGGAWSLDTDAPAGVLELHGADLLRARFADAASGCVPLTIDGAPAGQLCDNDP